MTYKYALLTSAVRSEILLLLQFLAIRKDVPYFPTVTLLPRYVYSESMLPKMYIPELGQYVFAINILEDPTDSTVYDDDKYKYGCQRNIIRGFFVSCGKVMHDTHTYFPTWITDL